MPLPLARTGPCQYSLGSAKLVVRLVNGRCGNESARLYPPAPYGLGPQARLWPFLGRLRVSGGRPCTLPRQGSRTPFCSVTRAGLPNCRRLMVRSGPSNVDIFTYLEKQPVAQAAQPGAQAQQRR